jgi:hypothetical protein
MSMECVVHECGRALYLREKERDKEREKERQNEKELRAQVCFMLARVRTPSSWVRERERERERKQKREREGGSEKDT